MFFIEGVQNGLIVRDTTLSCGSDQIVFQQKDSNDIDYIRDALQHIADELSRNNGQYQVVVLKLPKDNEKNHIYDVEYRKQLAGLIEKISQALKIPQ